MKDELSAYFAQQQLPLPPFIAYINIDAKNKHQIFELGMIDYISHPLIKQELSYRIQQILSNLKISTIDSFSNFDQKKFNQLTINTKQVIGISHELAEKTANYLLKNLTHEINLIQLSREMATNRNKLSNAFKAHFGCTIFFWLREQRMLHASQLLTTTNKTILAVSHAVGYPDSNNFSTAFKRTYQLSPLQYRQKYKVHQTGIMKNQGKSEITDTLFN